MQATPSLIRRLLKGFMFLLLLSLPIVFWMNRFEVHDWWRLRSYSPSPEVQAITENTKMQPYAKRIFYANHPRFDDKEQLADDCKQVEYTIVLGCYVPGSGIYLYNVPDPRLNGAKEVTASHEMLHVAYDRLSSSERKRINKLLDQAFSAVTDERIRATVEQYRQKDPKIVPNELHSIMGTEVRTLSPELEEYYKKYFQDRGVVVAFSEQYESEFTSRQTQVKAYDEQLASLKAQINSNQSQLETESNTIQQEKNRLDGYLSSGNYSAYNTNVDDYNSRIASYNSLARATRQLIEEYNSVVQQRNALALEVNDLVKAIDSRPEGISTQ